MVFLHSQKFQVFFYYHFPSTLRTFFHTYFHAVLLVMNSLCFSLPENIFISASFLKGICCLQHFWIDGKSAFCLFYCQHFKNVPLLSSFPNWWWEISSQLNCCFLYVLLPFPLVALKRFCIVFGLHQFDYSMSLCVFLCFFLLVIHWDFFENIVFIFHHIGKFLHVI